MWVGAHEQHELACTYLALDAVPLVGGASNQQQGAAVKQP